MNKKYVEKLAEEHWSYVEKVLVVAGEDELTIAKIRFHYISAFIHGYKHAEDCGCK